MTRAFICLAAMALAFPAAALASDTVAPQPAVATAGNVGNSDNEIGPKDTIGIDVFDVPALSETTQVDNGGFVNMPLIGQVKAAGRSPNELASDIAKALRAKYMKNPIVTVSVKEAASKKITVDGSVTQPGLYEIGPNTTLMQAVALAHGPDQVADIHHVAIIRTTAGARATSVYDLDDIRDGKTADPIVHPNDEIVVDTSGSRKFVRDFGNVFSVLGWLHP